MVEPKRKLFDAHVTPVEELKQPIKFISDSSSSS